MHLSRSSRQYITVKFFIKTLQLALFCSPGFIPAQVFYSTDPQYLSSKKEGNNLLTLYKNSYPDTSISFISEFFPRNFLGNVGLASPGYELRYGSDDLGFRVYPVPYRQDKFLEKEVTYFRSKGPYASLTGIAGSRELQVFKFVFTHTLRKGPNIGIKFNRYTSLGFYEKQQTYTNNFMLTSNHSSSTNRWGYYLYVLNNGNKNRENGGISNGQLTDSTLLIRKELLSVRTHSANRDNAETAVMLNPWLRINNVKAGSPPAWDHFVNARTRVAYNKYRYSDRNIVRDSFYPFVYLDTVSTFDSTHLRQIRNELNYSVVSRKSGSAFLIGYRLNVNNFWQHGDHLLINHFARSEWVYRPGFHKGDSMTEVSRPFETRLSGQYVVKGPAEGNIKVESNSELKLGRNGSLRANVDLLYEVRNPDQIYLQWVSNHFFWENTGYKVTDQVQAKAGIGSDKFSLSIFVQQINNLLYFDQYALPRQLQGTVENIGIKASFGGIFFRHLGIFIEDHYQESSAPSYVRLPPNIFTGRLFLNSVLFKKNLQLQIGGQLQVYDSFYPYAYMPATQAFYIQETFITEPYPFVDIFLQARIRPVNFFFKVENVLQGYSGSNYALVPGYYQPDRAFRLGLTWMFFD